MILSFTVVCIHLNIRQRPHFFFHPLDSYLELVKIDEINKNYSSRTPHVHVLHLICISFDVSFIRL